jgi:hypothetical protein
MHRRFASADEMTLRQHLGSFKIGGDLVVSAVAVCLIECLCVFVCACVFVYLHHDHVILVLCLIILTFLNIDS